MKMNLAHVLTLLVWLCSFVVPSALKVCARDNSRVVANLVRQKILPAFRVQKTNLVQECPFKLERDMYAVQEENKVMENPNRWSCDFCGKAFVSEFFLDLHFENRHSDQVQVKDSLCLADVCEVFRCDIISGSTHPDYWDIALCLEDDMQDLYSQCQSLTASCIPKGLTQNQTETITNTVLKNVCSFLTCEKFWNTPYHQEETTHTALYIVLTTMTCFGIVIYNFVFYNYFYSEYSDATYDPTPKVKHKIKPYPYDRPHFAASYKHWKESV